MAGPTARVLALLELLQSGGLRTLTDLAERLDVDERTVRRYIGHLIDLEVPVESVRGRHGGYRLAPGYRVPPLMFTDDEALAALLGLITGHGGDLGTASATAAAKIRRVLPERLARRLDAVTGTVEFTAGAGKSSAGIAVPDGAVLLTLAAAITDRRPLTVRYTARDGRSSVRVLHPHGLVVHSRHWYVVGIDPGAGGHRTLRLDRIASARTLPGTFEPPDDGDSDGDVAQRMVAGFAEAAYRHRVTLQIQGTAEQIRTRLPAGVATVGPAGDGGWSRVELRVESLDWLPGVLAALDLPFAVERPGELKDRVAALADRLAASAHRAIPPPPAG